ncbi:hypothetical protein GLOIN_2v1869233 [Rhizophagus clarus]|uniref:SbsA Ig-like domain-containing protein n=1 Tax=Rhizophagus clarus TaxID=94130 RepID=A0A8H3LVU4_9GLOM|nr:hypothetical protein GLOIN_2v1869233 [Rhizophagus clarus]
MKLKRLLIFLSIIIFATLPVNSNFITYTEKETTNFEIGDILNYGDNTIVLQIVHNSSGGNCSETKISLRVIYPNGTIVPIDLSMEELGIQFFNFCIVNTDSGSFNPITLYAIETKKNNFILVTYTEAENENNPLTYDDYIMLIDLNGKIYSKTLMGPSLVVNNTWTPQQSSITTNVNNEQGFLYFAPISSGFSDIYTHFNLTQWIINDDGTLSNVAATIFALQVQPSIASTVDGGYMIIYPNTTTSQDLYTSQSGIYAVYYGYGSNILRDPIILYETIMQLDITTLDCVISYSEVGQICLITIQPNSTDPNPAPIFINVNYLSGGSVFNVDHLEATLPTIIGISEFNNPDFLIQPLRFGGYFYSVNQQINISDNQSPYNSWGFVLDDNGNFIQWNLSYPTQIDYSETTQVLKNNTLVMVQPIVGQNWNLITTNLPKIYQDNGYDNVLISNTYPPINQNIIANEIHFLTITYTVPVVLSNGAITIFQSNGSSNPGIVRQTVNGLKNPDYVTINNNTVNVTIIDSTFNNPGSTYYVTIENTFVSSLLYNEPLPGLSNNIWSFTTLPEEIKKESKIKLFFDGIYGKVKLNKDGTSHFDTLNSDQRDVFFDILTQELASALVVPPKRITTNYRSAIDTDLKQDYLAIKIEKPRFASDRETKLIAKELNAMIQNMDITVLTSGNSSKYLESTYGYVTILVWFLILTILCFISIYYDARIEVKSGSSSSVKSSFVRIMKQDIVELINFLNIFSSKSMVNERVDEDKSNHFKVYLYGFNVLSFVLDILFAKIEAGSVKNIFFASVFFVTVPYVIKLGYAVYIILGELVKKEKSEDSVRLLVEKENLEDSNDQQNGSQSQQDSSRGQQDKAKEKVTIKQWLEDSKDHKTILVIVISLAGTDTGTLEIFNFEFCGYKFNVKLSKKFEERIIIGEILGIVIKNMPDLAIRIYFLKKAIDFSYLSILTLTTSVVKILGLFTKPMKLKGVKAKRKE